MPTDPLPTPAAYLTQLRTLIASGQDQAALDYSAAVWPMLAPSLTGEELDTVSGLLAAAETALDPTILDYPQEYGTAPSPAPPDTSESSTSPRSTREAF
jgi:hypothetical protein